MRKLLTLLIFVFGFVGLAKAQQTQDVTANSTHEYTANPATGTSVKEYKWQLVNNSGAEVIDLSAEKVATVSIDFVETTFTAGETYQLKSQVIDNNDCISEVVYVEITIAGKASVMFADIAANDNVITCSLLTGDTPSDTNFDVVFTGGVAPYELTYTVTDKDGVTATLEETFNAKTGTLSVADFENTSSSNQVVTVTLVSALTDDNQNVTVDTGDAVNITGKNNIRTLTVYPKPVITNLTLN